MREVLRRCAAGSALVVGLAVGFSVAPTVSLAAPITFVGPADYDNNAAQTTGVFRDVLNGSLINSDLDLGGTGHTALNFTGCDNNSAVLGRTTLYDTNVSNGSQRCSLAISQSAPMFSSHPFNNSKGAGIVVLFNEGAGNQGIALSLWTDGNTDSDKVQLVQQTGETRPGVALSTVALGSVIAADVWYRLTMDLTFSDSNFTVTGKVFTHTTQTDPNSALGVQVGSTLTYSSALSATLFSPYEIGLVARATLRSWTRV